MNGRALPGREGKLPSLSSAELRGVKTRADVCARIASVDAARRRMLPAEGGASKSATNHPVLPRLMRLASTWAPSDLGADGFTVLQLNMLAEGLSSGPDDVTPFEPEQPGCFGGP